MQYEYIKEKKITDTTELEKEIELLHSIMITKEELKNNNVNFEYAQGDLVDYYIYQIKANQAKLDYLIKLAKSHGIKVDLINNIMIKNLNNQEVG